MAAHSWNTHLDAIIIEGALAQTQCVMKEKDIHGLLYYDISSNKRMPLINAWEIARSLR